jgi:hypothetical protein
VQINDVDAPAALPYLPPRQAVHTREVVAPATLPYRPASQAVQPLVPVVSTLYMPSEIPLTSLLR